jgi:hypothetical protein
VELRLGGVLALFWKSSSWFRRSDGVFLRFEGPSGPPGAPAVVVGNRGPAAPSSDTDFRSRPARNTSLLGLHNIHKLTRR